MDPLLNTLGTQIAHTAAHSALPGAPVVSDDTTVRRVRRGLGRGLHAVARRIEPVERPRYRAA